MKKFLQKTFKLAGSAASFSRREAERLIVNEDGETNLVAILLIIVVTVALVAIFKDRITDLVNTIFDKIEKSVGKI